MNLSDGEGEFTWPNGDRNPSIYRFQITSMLYRITLNALQIRGRAPDKPIGWWGAVHLARWWQTSEHLMFQITLLLYRITFNAFQIRGRAPDEPIGWWGAVHLVQRWQDIRAYMYMFQITLVLYRITLKALKIRGLHPDEAIGRWGQSPGPTMTDIRASVCSR